MSNFSNDSIQENDPLSETPEIIFPSPQTLPPKKRRLPKDVWANTFSILLIVFCFLLVLYLIPEVASQLVYQMTRGSERAKAETAAKLLKEFPAPETRIPWVVKKAGPSVVSIQPISRVITNNRKIFDAFTGLGSGIIVDKEGYIITNYHVVRAENRFQVTLSDGRSTQNVRFVGGDPGIDLAVLKIDIADLTPMEWGDSTALAVGEPVLAIGNPYGFSNTVTYGIISAKERYTRDFNDSNKREPQEYLQTDAAVNPGNSGGPLVNMQGEMVGINTAIFGETYLGICFSIPSALAKKVYEEIRKKGKLSFGLLGVQLGDSSLNTEGRAIGVVIDGVMPGYPAEKAGIQPGDVITNWNGTEIHEAIQLNHAILFTSPGAHVKVACLRDGKRIEFEVTVAKRPVRMR
ncbi:MAG: trypsin-like peptidase domain-containing protein [Planctomycetaceae bacterium]|jgi:S1-C subfamily serine protease|nr:trypsin-like peptidase domain-containing protein [Planctomycetaceae bacterium]